MSQGPQHKTLDDLLAYAEGYAEFSMRKLGRVPPSLLAISPNGSLHFIPASLKDVRAKDSFANTARLICLGYEVTAAVLVLESWMKMARPGETLDMTEPPSEAFDRREVVVLTGETAQHCKQMLLPIIRTDAGGFFGFVEHDGPKLDNLTGRFAQVLPRTSVLFQKVGGGRLLPCCCRPAGRPVDCAHSGSRRVDSPLWFPRTCAPSPAGWRGDWCPVPSSAWRSRGAIHAGEPKCRACAGRALRLAAHWLHAFGSGQLFQ